MIAALLVGISCLVVGLIVGFVLGAMAVAAGSERLR